MPLNWNNYDAYFNDPRDQQQIDDNRKIEIERIAGEILHLDAQTMKSNWGSCSPPGVFAQTVVRVESSTPNRFTSICQNKAIGLKIFKNGKGCKLVHGHTHSRRKLPGLPNDFVQEVYDADEHNGTFFLAQAWIEGESLETYLNRKTHLPPDVAQQLLKDLFEGIIIPLWSAGTIWWDFRAGNFCVTERDSKQRLVLIKRQSIRLGRIERIGADEVAGAGHVADDEGGAGQVTLHELGDEATVCVVISAGRGGDDVGYGLAVVVIGALGLRGCALDERGCQANSRCDPKLCDVHSFLPCRRSSCPPFWPLCLGGAVAPDSG